ncbi:unnamed protein product, partial [Phaeothamnion confervicola]
LCVARAVGASSYGGGNPPPPPGSRPPPRKSGEAEQSEDPSLPPPAGDGDASGAAGVPERPESTWPPQNGQNGRPGGQPGGYFGSNEAPSREGGGGAAGQQYYNGGLPQGWGAFPQQYDYGQYRQTPPRPPPPQSNEVQYDSSRQGDYPPPPPPPPPPPSQQQQQQQQQYQPHRQQQYQPQQPPLPPPPPLPPQGIGSFGSVPPPASLAGAITPRATVTNYGQQPAGFGQAPGPGDGGGGGGGGPGELEEDLGIQLHNVDKEMVFENLKKLYRKKILPLEVINMGGEWGSEVFFFSHVFRILQLLPGASCLSFSPVVLVLQTRR